MYIEILDEWNNEEHECFECPDDKPNYADVRISLDHEGINYLCFAHARVLLEKLQELDLTGDTRISKEDTLEKELERRAEATSREYWDSKNKDKF